MILRVHFAHFGPPPMGQLGHLANFPKLGAPHQSALVLTLKPHD